MRQDTQRLRERLRSWLEGRLGTPLRELTGAPVRVLELAACENAPPPLLAVKMDESALMTARPAWQPDLSRAIQAMSVEELFSIYGVYEISRVTMTDGFSAWGPYLCYAGDEASMNLVTDPRVSHLDPEEVQAAADPKIFWHCFQDEAPEGFGAFEDGKLVSLATIRRESDDLVEIGIDSAPDHKGRGLGRAVASAAARHILDQGKLVWWTTSPWNVPSSRLAKSVGMPHLWSEMICWEHPLMIPPQPLGSPTPNARMENYYPDWARNRSIQPRSW